MLNLALGLLTANWRAVAIGGAVFAAISVGALFVHHERVVGARDLADKINRQNQEARDAALSGARDVDACYALGGVWSVRDDKCDRP